MQYFRQTGVNAAAIILLVIPGACALAQSPASRSGPVVEDDKVPSLASTIAAMPKNLPRAKAPGLDESIAAARAAVRACDAKNAKVSVLVSDAQARPVVLLSGDGAGYRSQLIAQTKVRIATRWKMPSGEVEQRAKSDPALAAQAAADPEIGVLRGGGFPLFRNGELVGAVAVSGASLTGPIGLDEECAKVALAMLDRSQSQR